MMLLSDSQTNQLQMKFQMKPRIKLQLRFQTKPAACSNHVSFDAVSYMIQEAGSIHSCTTSDVSLLLCYTESEQVHASLAA
jgi:hypothetical protein